MQGLRDIQIDEMAGAVFGWVWCRWICEWLWVNLYWPPDDDVRAAPRTYRSLETIEPALRVREWTGDG